MPSHAATKYEPRHKAGDYDVVADLTRTTTRPPRHRADRPTPRHLADSKGEAK